MSYLKDYLSTLPAHQKEAIERIIQQKQDVEEIKSTEEFERETKRKMEAVLENRPTPLFRHENQVGLIDAIAYNEEIEKLYVDLYTLFSESLKTDRLINDHHRLNLSAFSEADQKIQELKALVDLYEVMLGNKEEYVIPILHDFSSSTMEKDTRFYHGTPRVEIDTTMQTMRLPTQASNNRIRSKNGSTVAEIAIIGNVGRPMVSTQNHVNNAIDGNDKTFWSEVVLAEAPLNIDGEQIDPELFKDITQGAACAVEITFDYSAPLSTLSLKPFTEFPLDICSIDLFDDVRLHEPVKRLIPDSDSWIQSNRPIILEFEEVNTKKVRIVLRQNHNVMRSYLIEKDAKTDQEIWRQMRKQSNTSTFLDNEMSGEYPGWEDYRDSMQRWHDAIDQVSHLDKDADIISGSSAVLPGNTDILLQRAKDLIGKDIVVPDHKDLVQLTRYEYVYGFYDIDAMHRTYKDLGVYISEPLDIKGNVREITMQTMEDIPMVQVEQENGSLESIPVGSIEWYVGNNMHWLPILPEYTNGQLTREVIGERCVIENDGSITPRFHVDQSRLSSLPIVLYSNGVRVPDKAWKPSISYKDGICSFKVDESYHNSVLTITYPVDVGKGAHTVNFQRLLAPKNRREVFEPNSNAGEERLVELSYYPYVDYSAINAGTVYNPISVYIESESLLCVSNWVSTRSHHPEGYHLVNKTDYVNQTLPILEPATEDNKEYQFRHRQKLLTFGESLKDATITVEYQTLTENLRIKAILIKNQLAHESLSPKVRNYTVKPKVINLF